MDKHVVVDLGVMFFNSLFFVSVVFSIFVLLGLKGLFPKKIQINFTTYLSLASLLFGLFSILAKAIGK